MSFTEVSRMDSRRKLAFEVIDGGVSLSAACSHAGVTRKTGRKWVNRAKEIGIEHLAELSRTPKTVRSRTSSDVEAALVELKAKHPYWGAKKLVPLLAAGGILLPLRTADRILDRFGLTTPRPPAQPEPIRFERERCGALLQMDFKGLPVTTSYSILTVLDDMARYCCHFAPVVDKTGPSVIAALWEVFGVHGLPDEMLMDNGDCWGTRESHAPTRFGAWLMRLGVKPIHGRPRHPQTQGKVERFHGTAKLEMGEQLVQQSVQSVRSACEEFVKRYNWVRPHEAIGFAVPGSRYCPWPRTRPAQMPKHKIPEGAISRCVCEAGAISYKGTTYKLGRGLTGERILIKEAEFGLRVFYADFPLSYLHEMNSW
jgi:transposase InsO family protein